jgi:hypothetical protein
MTLANDMLLNRAPRPSTVAYHETALESRGDGGTHTSSNHLPYRDAPDNDRKPRGKGDDQAVKECHKLMAQGEVKDPAEGIHEDVAVGKNLWGQPKRQRPQ